MHPPIIPCIPPWGVAQAVPPAAAGLGAELGLWTVLPFAGLLLSIALLPLAAGRFWERNRNKALVCAAFAAPIAAYLALAHGAAGVETLLEKAHEYASFLCLLGSLFVISSGIHVSGSLAGTPLVNTLVLAAGAVLANLIGTTGASVLLIRPLLRANRSRRDRAHVVIFFIFVVSNCGGLLTPLGDPPLFLGYLKGVPFAWTLSLWKPWLFVVALLLAIFHVVDQLVLNAEEGRRRGSQLEDLLRHERLGLRGAHNFVFLAGVVAAIWASGAGAFHGGEPWPAGAQEAAMALCTLGSWLSTPREVRAANAFTWGPIAEVAVLFAGIFATMAPALLILNAWGQGQRLVLGQAMEMRAPWQFLWSTGLLSGFLDNAPTYLTFAATASGSQGVPAEGAYLGELLGREGEGAALLAAISCGAVWMGAITYVGNGPNFMVKAIAEESGLRMPGFFAYMAWSGLVLLPVFALATLVFFA